MKVQKFYSLFKYLIAAVWLVNGLYCKLLNGVPRHRLIVERILGTSHAPLITTLIGIAEIGMCLWILSNYKSRFNAIFQIVIIGLMNGLEFFLVPDLLLWGKVNAIFALLFMLFITWNEFVLTRKIEKHS